MLNKQDVLRKISLDKRNNEVNYFVTRKKIGTIIFNESLKKHYS